jgi:outer membrane protein assembly factor BamB
MLQRIQWRRFLAVITVFVAMGGFVGWLTTRDPVVVHRMSLTKDAGLAGHLVFLPNGGVAAADLRQVHSVDAQGNVNWRLDLWGSLGMGGQYPDLEQLADGSLVTAWASATNGRHLVWITNGVVRRTLACDLAQAPMGGRFAVVVSNDVCVALKEAVALFGPDGSERWRFESQAPVVSAPVRTPEGDWLFEAPSPATNVMFRLRADGTLRWRRETEPGYGMGPAVRSDGSFVWGRGPGLTLAAFDADGNPLWQLGRPEVATCMPAMAAGDVAIVGAWEIDKPVRLLSVDRAGKVLWETPLSQGNLSHSPVVAPDGTIYVVTMDRWVRAFDAQGHLKWRYRVSWRMDRYLPRGLGELVGWWKQRMGYARPVGTGPPQLDAQGRLWIAFSHDGALFRFGPGNGEGP